MLGPGILDDTAAVEAESSNLSISDDDEVMVDPDDLLEYENLMRSRLPSIPPVDLSYLEDVTTIPQQTEGHGDERTEAEREAEKTMTKAEKQNAKKKRRKERERAMKQMVEDAIGPGRRGETIHAEVEAEKQIREHLYAITIDREWQSLRISFPPVLLHAGSTTIPSARQGGLSDAYVRVHLIAYHDSPERS